MKKRRYRYAIFKFDPESFTDYDYSDRLQEYADKWSQSHSHVRLDKDDVDNAIRFMAEQVNSRSEYDWNGLVDLSAGVVRIPMVDFDELDSSSRYTLTKNGLVEHLNDECAVIDQHGMGLDRRALTAYIKNRIGEWVDVALLYSAGGLVDMQSASTE